MDLRIYPALMIVSLASCVTSSQLAQKDTYVDPTNVRTVDAPAASANNDAISRELDIVRGQLEDAQHQVQLLETENRRLGEELAKAKAPPPAAPAASAGVPPALGSDGPAAGSQKTGAPLLWELAQKDLADGRSKEALGAFQEILSSYPKDARVLHSSLAAAMLQYRLENYKDAALAFNQFIDKNPRRTEAAIAWFGQGAAFNRMGQREDAKLFYEETVKRFPKSEAAAEAKRFMGRRGTAGAPKDLFSVFPKWAERAPR